jgi:hypothetical protein
MAISIPIISEFSPKGIDKAVKEFKRLETNGQKAQFLLKKAALPAAAALGALAAAATVSVKAAIQDQKAQVQLARQLKASAGASDSMVKAVEGQIAALEAASGVADDELRPALAALVRGTGDVSKGMDGLKLAMDISAATGRDLQSVTDALSLAYGGNMRGLRTLSPEMFKLVKEGASLDEVMRALSGTFGGAMAAQADTAAGRLARLQRSVENLQENIGYILLPFLEAVLPKLQRLADWARDNPDKFVKVGAAIGIVATAIVGLKVAASISAALTALGIAAGLVGIKMWAAIAAIMAYKFAIDKVSGSLGEVNSKMGLFNYVVQRISNPLGMAAIAIDGMSLSFKALTGRSESARASVAAFGKSFNRLTEDFKDDDALVKARQTAQNLEDIGAAAGKAGKSVESYSERFKKALGDAASAARDRLKSVSDEMRSFADGVRDALLGGLGFGAALEAGEETGAGFVAGLQAQVERVAEFSKQVRQLVELGLSKDALSRVLEAGEEAGAEIAAQLIAGGADAIAETNRLVESARLAADEVGLLAGEKYFSAGVKFAADVVAGLEAELLKLTPKVMARMDELAKKMRRTVTIDVRINQIVGRIEAGAGIPALADGGIVTRPTLALIGEAGPEAVVPLSGRGGGGGFGGDTTINIYSTIADESLPEKLVQALRTYNRTTGPVRIQVL